MSFDVVCNSCGAMSGPSVGICPFCKSVLSSSIQKTKGHSSISELYQTGKTDIALSMAQKVYREDEKARQDISFLLTYIKILIETEGPSSLINSLIAQGLLVDVQNQDLADYYEIIYAKTNLKKGLGDAGEMSLKKVIRKSPNNVHALFLLGSHLYWIDNNPAAAAPYLERCVQLTPNFLRAWGCLAAVYMALDNPQLVRKSLEKCIELETNSTMKNYFNEELKKIS